MIRLLTDENLDHDLVRGDLRRRTELDLVRVQSVGLTQTDDPYILAWAARERRLVTTRNGITGLHQKPTAKVNTAGTLALSSLPLPMRTTAGVPFSALTSAGVHSLI